MIRFPVNRHRVWQLFFDALLVAAAWRLTFFLLFDQIRPFYRHLLDWRVYVLVVAINLASFVLFGFYNRWWRYVSTRDMWGAFRGVTVGSAVAFLVLYAFPPHDTARLPRRVAALDYLLILAFVAGSRMIARTFIERPRSGGLVARGKEVLVVGAGDAGRLIVGEMQRNRQLHYTPIGFLDDDPRKKDLRVLGVRVLGPTGDLAHILRDNRPDEVLIAIPSAAGETRRRVVDACGAAGVPVKTLPGLHELISGDVGLAHQIRPVQVEDVLGREPVEVDLQATATYVKGKTVLVSGAGGSIGSELCRQLSRIGAARLVLVDKSESALFEIERELVQERDYEAGIPVLVDCGDRARMRRVFEQYEPQVVFHAAAYKHVGMLEADPLPAVANNVLGTRAVAEEAIEAGVERFVLISTDKAANPHNVMGRSKALCEWIVESLALRPDARTRFVAVRFGNVLGSSGSVIPIFRRQIERGGPVTVRHPEMTRFFMTIPEAASLVVQAGAMGGRGQVYVLDMGQPVRILDLARQMIRLSGRSEDEIPIQFTGARPGEKIHEVLWSEGEAVGPTSHPKIMRAARPAIDPAWLEDELADLERLVEESDSAAVAAKLAAMVDQPKRTGAKAVLEDTLH